MEGPVHVAWGARGRHTGIGGFLRDVVRLRRGGHGGRVWGCGGLDDRQCCQPGVALTTTSPSTPSPGEGDKEKGLKRG